NGSVRWRILNERRHSIRATPKSQRKSEILIGHCVSGRMRSAPNCGLSPLIRTAQMQRYFLSELASSKRAMSTPPAELSMVVQRPVSHAFSPASAALLHSAMLEESLVTGFISTSSKDVLPMLFKLPRRG